MVSSCTFCGIMARSGCKIQEVCRSDPAVGFFPTAPAVLGDCMIVPRRHVKRFTVLPDDEASQFMLVTKTMPMCIREAFLSEGISIVQSNDEATTQSVRHVHIHIGPRCTTDQIGDFCSSSGTNFSEQEKDPTLAIPRSTTVLPSNSVSTDDNGQHLTFAQSVVTRMAQPSWNAKS